MARVKGGVTTLARRKKILKLAKGYFGSKHTLYRTAHEQVMRSLQYAYRDRRQTKRNFRRLWIARINAAAVANDFKYSKLVHGLSLANVLLNRKVLADLAVSEPQVFTSYVQLAKDAIANPAKYATKSEAPKAEKPKAVAKPAVKETPAKEVVKAAPKASEPVLEAQPLEKLLVADLKEIAANLNIADYTSLKKAELIEAIKKAKK